MIRFGNGERNSAGGVIRVGSGERLCEASWLYQFSPLPNQTNEQSEIDRKKTKNRSNTSHEANDEDNKTVLLNKLLRVGTRRPTGRVK